MVVFGQCGCIRARIVVFGEKLFYSGKWFYFGKSFCIWAKVVVFGNIGYIPKKWLYSDMVVKFGQKWLYLGK